MAGQSIPEGAGSVLAVLLLSSLSVQAQQKLFVAGGPSLAAMSSGPFGGNLAPTWITTHALGLGWSYATAKRIEIKAGLFHERRGDGGKASLLGTNGNILANGTLKYRWDHVTLPVSIGVRSAGPLAVFGMLGVVPAYTRHVDLHIPAFQGMPSDHTEIHTADASAWTVGVSVEAGGAYALNERLGALAAVRYYNGLAPVELGVIEWRQRSVTFLLGLEWRLSKGASTDRPADG